MDKTTRLDVYLHADLTSIGMTLRMMMRNKKEKIMGHKRAMVEKSKKEE